MTKNQAKRCSAKQRKFIYAIVNIKDNSQFGGAWTYSSKKLASLVDKATITKDRYTRFNTPKSY